jgi:hypothetical protein
LANEADRLRAQAARCLRLSTGAVPDDVKARLRALAAESLEKAHALERAADQQRQQQQVGNVVPLPEPAYDSVQQQQQQQVQPKDDGKE